MLFLINVFLLHIPTHLFPWVVANCESISIGRKTTTRYKKNKKISHSSVKQNTVSTQQCYRLFQFCRNRTLSFIQRRISTQFVSLFEKQIVAVTSFFVLHYTTLSFITFIGNSLFKRGSNNLIDSLYFFTENMIISFLKLNFSLVCFPVSYEIPIHKRCRYTVIIP